MSHLPSCRLILPKLTMPARLDSAVIGRIPEQARKAAADYIESVYTNLREIELEEQRLVRATMRLEGWD